MDKEFLHGPWRAALIPCLAVMASCGGGGGGGDAVPQGGGSGGGSTPPPPATESCATPVLTAPGGGFRQTTADLGLCYDVRELEPVAEIQIQGGGFAMGDIDNDGDEDLYVAHGIGEKGQLFLFDGTRFNAAPNNNGIDPSHLDNTGFFFDIDNDGWLDFLSVQYNVDGVEVFMNDGTGSFADDNGVSGIYLDKSTFSLAASDFDLDGDLDLFMAHWAFPWRGSPKGYLWENDGAGFFTDISGIMQISPVPAPPPNEDLLVEYSFTPILTHIDGDRYPDLLLTGDFESTQVLINIDGASFVDMTGAAITDENGMGATVADYDSDGDMDWFVSSIHFRGSREPGYDGGVTGNRLYRNDGFGVFEDVTDAAGVREGGWGWGACFADFNNDGHADIFHTNGMRTLSASETDTSHPMYTFFDDPSRLFMSQGDGTFLEQADALGINHVGHGRGVMCHDYDGDGRVDIFIANNGDSPTVYRNEITNSNRYIQVDLAGTIGNPNGVGARVVVRTPAGAQTQDVLLGSNYLAQQPATLHFGLGAADTIESITVAWPDAAGTQTVLTNVDTNQRITISRD